MFRFPPLTPFVKKLLITLFGAWIAQIILQNWAGVPMFELLALNTGSFGVATLWQLGTHIFAFPTGPQAVFSMLIVLLFLWWMLAPFEQRFGQKRTIQLCVVATMSAALLALVIGMIVPAPSRLYGAQAILLGAIAAFAWSYRGQGRMSFFGVIDMKPVHIIYLVLALSALMFITSGDAVALAADLGAIGGGMGFIEWLRRPPTRRRRRKRRKKKSSFDVVQGGRADEPRWLN
ncbi:MAG: rhomboid family intramembrane serine protease [Deltaproteobacteria bacterium]|nr:rhomboid family intramembrane serine protease [Deltaproteobacteria bacterium]